ncbi:hypothetical protein CTI12_AA626350 [Artemisia annua]|uniref:Uncharacterized protein n=1 Tax=Artemisia annua TaxID=35608 RepID=A0A2U1KA98_ARTAN|nr:hypothetical protein CTI12_AA626350 [Artemisia annua]
MARSEMVETVALSYPCTFLVVVGLIIRSEVTCDQVVSNRLVLLNTITNRPLQLGCDPEKARPRRNAESICLSRSAKLIAQRCRMINGYAQKKVPIYSKHMFK